MNGIVQWAVTEETIKLENRKGESDRKGLVPLAGIGMTSESSSPLKFSTAFQIQKLGKYIYDKCVCRISVQGK